MNIILLQEQLLPSEIDQLIQEFPHYLFLSLSEAGYKSLQQETWERIEIIYGNRLNPEELAKAPQLRWIHSPTPNLNRMCLNEIERQGNILVSNTKEENIAQIGEYAISGMLAFAKGLFKWKEANQYPSHVWDNKLRDAMWTLEDRLLLQIGLGNVGTEVTRRARQFNMRVWGVQPETTFHPFCHETFTLKEKDSVIPLADVVCVSLPRGKDYDKWFQEAQLRLMKEDSILIILGSHNIVDEEVLLALAEAGKFRGIVIDALYQTPIPFTSKLWKVPNILMTPEVAPRPKSSYKVAFRNFRYNLRQYTHSNFNDMRNLIDRTVALLV